MALTMGGDRLRDFLTAEAAKGGEACHLLVLRWHEQVTGVSCDALVPDAERAERVGLYRGMLRVCRCLKLAKTQAPRRGDVGLFRVGNLLMAGICLGQGWAARTPLGIGVFRHTRVFRAWAPQ